MVSKVPSDDASSIIIISTLFNGYSELIIESISLSSLIFLLWVGIMTETKGYVIYNYPLF